jgi:hypothetical protein
MGREQNKGDRVVFGGEHAKMTVPRVNPRRKLPCPLYFAVR